MLDRQQIGSARERQLEAKPVALNVPVKTERCHSTSSGNPRTNDDESHTEDTLNSMEGAVVLMYRPLRPCAKVEPTQPPPSSEPHTKNFEYRPHVGTELLRLNGNIIWFSTFIRDDWGGCTASRLKLLDVEIAER